MNRCFLRKFFSFFLSFIILFQSSAFYLVAFAQEATESATQTVIEPTPTPAPPAPTESRPSAGEVGTPSAEIVVEPGPTPVPEWQTIDDVDVTTSPVAEGHTYKYRDTTVTVTFTKITQPAPLKIKQVQVGDVTGYDITSDMPDGSFVYDLTLPNPNPNQETTVQYSEDGQTYQELPSEKQNGVFVIKNLDHFTIFVVSPGESIQSAIDMAAGGDTIHVDAGVYAEDLTVSTSNLTLEGENRDTVIIKPSNIGLDILPADPDATISGVTVQNLTINASDSGAIGVSVLQANNILLNNLVLFNSGTALDISSSKLVNILGASLSGYMVGLSLSSDTSNITASSSAFASSADWHIINNSSSGVTATGNDWGTSDGSAINDRIYDHLDDESLGLVQYDADPPQVDAGLDVTTNTSFNQSASASDTYGLVSTSWSQVSGPGTASFSPFSADTNGTYVLRLTATDYQGNENTDDFTLVWDTTAPSIPALSSPASGTSTTDTSPTLAWLVSTDTLSGTKDYRVQVDNNSGFSSPEKNYYTDNLFYSPTLTENKWYWRVKARDNALNWSDWSTAWNFIVDTTVPASVPTSPAAGYYKASTWPGKTTGTATDNLSGVNLVEVAISDGTNYWNGTDWTGSQTWFAASGIGSWEYVYTPNKDGEFTFYSRATDTAGNTESTGTLSGVVYDTTAPIVSWTTPIAGGTISGSSPLVVSATDATSEVATTVFSYQRQDGVDTFHLITSPWDTSSLPLDNYTLRTIVTDNAGNATTVDETVEVAAVVTGQSSSTTATNSFTITWTTDRLTSGYIIYDTISHAVLSSAPGYGYAFISSTVDASPKTASHTIVLSGLSANTQYFWRTVSFGSPTAVSPEYFSRTFSEASAGGGGGGGGGNSTVNTSPTVPPAPAAVLGVATEETEEEILPPPTPTPPSSPEVKSATTFNFNWWLVIIPAALLGLTISGLLLRRRP